MVSVRNEGTNPEKCRLGANFVTAGVAVVCGVFGVS
jgi:hypothetical protein